MYTVAFHSFQSFVFYLYLYIMNPYDYELCDGEQRRFESMCAVTQHD